MEFSFSNFSHEFFLSIPSLLKSTTEWLRRDAKDFKFVAHSFAYFNHAFVKDEPVEAVLLRIGPKSPRSIGKGLGNGAIYHSVVHEKRWNTRFMLDRSVPVVGALFTGLTIDAERDYIEYGEFLAEGRTYYELILADFELQLPESERIL